MKDDCSILGVFAKQPAMGQAKSRLAAATSAAWALRVAEALLEDSLDRFAQVWTRRVIVFAPALACEHFNALARGRYECLPQTEGELGERLQHFFAAARSQGMSRIVAVGTDSPTVPISYIEQAFVRLETHDVVLGPAFDGGYYLIGCGAKDVPVFDSIPWSTPQVFGETVRRVGDARATLALLPPWYDVDTADDWAMLCGHVQAMRLAGIDPAVPRVTRLIREVISSQSSPS